MVEKKDFTKLDLRLIYSFDTFRNTLQIYKLNNNRQYFELLLASHPTGVPVAQDTPHIQKYTNPAYRHTWLLQAEVVSPSYGTQTTHVRLT